MARSRWIAIAQGTDAFQLSKTLLLHPESRSDARPQLRIGADQVRCTHGATSGPLAPDQLHYLQSRGIPSPYGDRHAGTRLPG